MEIQLMMFGLEPDKNPERSFRGAYLEDIRIEAIALELFGGSLRYGVNGGNPKMLCVFHKERTPSFFVRPKYNTYRCFGCGSFGGPIELLERCHPDPLRYLEQKFWFDKNSPADLARLERLRRR